MSGDNDSFGTALKQKLLRPFSKRESTLLFVALFFIMLDAFTTLTLCVTEIGFETNRVLSLLLQINPFLVYPFLLSMLIPVYVFRFHPTTEYGTTIVLILIHSLASINNMGVIFYRVPIVLNYFGYPFGETFKIPFTAFIVGSIYVGAYSMSVNIKNNVSLFNGAKSTSLNYLAYLVSYLFLNTIPIIWFTIF